MFFCCADLCSQREHAETIISVPTGKVFSDDFSDDEVRIQVFPDEEKPFETQSTEASSTLATLSDASAHAEQFAVTICKSSADAKIGLDIVPKDGKMLKVKQVKRDGPVKAWNAEHLTKRVRAGDRIVEVNGVRGDAEAMLRVIAETQEVVMTVQRPW